MKTNKRKPHKDRMIRVDNGTCMTLKQEGLNIWRGRIEAKKWEKVGSR